MADTHYVDQYIRNKRRSEAGTPSAGYDSTAAYGRSTASPVAVGPSSSSASYQPQLQQHQHQASQYQQHHAPSSSARLGPSSAAAAIMTAAHRAQQEVDAVSTAAADLALREEHAERVERQYHLLSERCDTAALSVASCEDKIINVTKMLKLAQTLSEDREKTLRDECGELRTKIKRLERSLELERESREKMSESMTGYIKEAIERAMEKHNVAMRAEFQRQLDQFEVTVRGVTRQQDGMKTEVDEVRRAADKFSSVLREVEQFCHKFSEETRSSARALVDSRLEEMRIRGEGQQQRVEDLRGKIEDVHDRLAETVTGQHELRRSLEDVKRRADPLKEWVEERVGLLKHEVGEQLRAETDKITSHLHVSLANTNDLMEVNESTIQATRDELEKLAAAVHAHVKNTDAGGAKTAEQVQDLREINQQSRELLVGQIEATKDWASRNILRLKKHLDLAVSDMAATRQAQLEMQVSFQRLTQAHHDEKAALLQELAQKKKESSLLTGMVDREVDDVRNMMANFNEAQHNAAARRQARDELRLLSTM